MNGWKALLEKTRAYNRAKPKRYDLRRLWRADAYRKFSTEPEPIIRAEAFASVLHQAPLYIYPGDLFAGSRVGFVTDDLPDGLSEDEYAAASRLCETKGQRNFTAGFDHTLADYSHLLETGIAGLVDECAESIATHNNGETVICLQAMAIALNALSNFAKRYATILESSGEIETARILRKISEHPPETFREALQLVWLTHIAFISEGRYAMALGRIDQYLLPFYQRDIKNGVRRDEILEMACNIWAKIEELGEVTNICIGGLTPDGADATNELSYIFLDATRLVQSPHTNLSARFHDGSPDEFHRACFECIRTGVGFPAIFNDHVLIEGLVEIGIPLDVARDYCLVGCIETMLPGRQPAWSDSRFNTPLSFLKSLNRFLKTTDLSFETLKNMVRDDLAADIKSHTDQINNVICRYPVSQFHDPFLSALTAGCIAKGKDINDGGADFERLHGIAIMGLATIADSMAAVRKIVIEERAISPDDLKVALETDFNNSEPLRQWLLNHAPKYGNGDPYVDEIAAWFVDAACEECLRHRIPGGGRYVACMAANTQNISAGKEVAATPDGRRAFTPLSDAASPYFGRDMLGPTAFLQSVAAPNYRHSLGGTVINMKFEPSLFDGDDGWKKFGAITRYFVRERIQELQFNVTGNEILIAARKTPADYRNLVVRVSGFSAYYTSLEPEVQDDIIRRRAHA